MADPADTHDCLYHLTLVSESDGHGGQRRELILTLRSDLLQDGTTLAIQCGTKRFRVIEET